MTTEYSVNENSKVYYIGKYWNDYQECLSKTNKRLFDKDISWKTYLIENNFRNFDRALILNAEMER